jgi:hypothetical protein
MLGYLMSINGDGYPMDINGDGYMVILKYNIRLLLF